MKVAARRLGFREDAVLKGTNVHTEFPAIVSARYSQALTRQQLYPALNDVVTREPLLGVNLFGVTTSKPTIGKLDAINLEEITFFDEQAQYDDAYATKLAHSTTLKYASYVTPLWRIHVLSGGHTVVFVYDPVVLDSISGVFFHRALVKSLNKGSLLPSLNNPLIPVSALTLPETTEELIGAKRSLKLLDRLLASSGSSSAAKLWTGPPRGKGDTQATMFDVDSTLVGRLEQVAETNGLTLEALVYSALMRALLHLLPEDWDEAGSCRLKTYVALDGRPFAKTHTAHHMSNRFGNLELSRAVDLDVTNLHTTDPEHDHMYPRLPWAHEFDAALQPEALANVSHLYFDPNVSALASQARAGLATALAGARPFSLSLYSQGYLVPTEVQDTDIVIEHVNYWRLCNPVTSAVVATMTTIGQTMSVTLATCMEYEDGPGCERLKRLFLAILQRIVEKEQEREEREKEEEEKKKEEEKEKEVDQNEEETETKEEKVEKVEQNEEETEAKEKEVVEGEEKVKEQENGLESAV